MADSVFKLLAQLGKGLAGFFGNEDRVIAKAPVAHRFFRYISVHTAAEQMLLATSDKGNGSAETCFAVSLAFHLGKQLAHIGRSVVTVGCIASGMHSRSTTQCFNLKPRVVGKTIVAIILIDIA